MLRHTSHAPPLLVRRPGAIPRTRISFLARSTPCKRTPRSLEADLWMQLARRLGRRLGDGAHRIDRGENEAHGMKREPWHQRASIGVPRVGAALRERERAAVVCVRLVRFCAKRKSKFFSTNGCFYGTGLARPENVRMIRANEAWSRTAPVVMRMFGLYCGTDLSSGRAPAPQR